MISDEPKSTSASGVRHAFAFGFLAILLSLSAGARACNVPVHRYLLVSWEREPYRVYYFYRGEQDKADEELNKFLENAGSSIKSHVNLYFRSVDVDGLGDRPLAARDREVWEEHKTDELPFHLLLSPIGNPLFRGRMDLATVKAMIQSPARARLARQLCEKEGGVLLLLTGGDEKESERAEKDVQWVLGKVEEEHGLDVGFLRVSRSDIREEWLIRCLLDGAGNPLDDGRCMVFGICGRGRVLVGCIGEGINRENLMECVYFMSGDCSCDLRFANPGMDLLTDWDWEGAVADLPLMIEDAIPSVLLGFNDSDEMPSSVSFGETGARPSDPAAPSLRRVTLTRWGVTFGATSLIVLGVGLVILKRRKEI